MKHLVIIIICGIMLVNTSVMGVAETRIPPMFIRGEKDRPVSLILGSFLSIKDERGDSLYLDSSIDKIRLVSKDISFREELKVFKKYRFQYAMFAGIIFAGLFFVIINK